MTTKKNLIRRRGGGYAVIYYIPTELQAVLGKREVVRGLGNSDHKEALAKKARILLAIQQEVAQWVPLQHDAQVFTETCNLPTQIERSVDVKEKPKPAPAPSLKPRHQKTKILPAMEQWLSEGTDVKQGTLNRYRTAIEELSAWAKGLHIEDIDRRKAGEYVTFLKSMVSFKTGQPIAPKTQSFKLNVISQFWRWCTQRGILDPEALSPWRGQSSAAPGQRNRKPQAVKELRGIQKDEAQKWLRAVNHERYKYAQAMNDLIILAWHTGIRANDICELTEGQISFDNDEGIAWLTIMKGKTEANTRILPIVSPEGQRVIKRRCESARNGELFPELERAGEDGKKYHMLQKSINAIRRKMLKGVPVDIHSFRRKFSNACEDVAHDPVQWSRMMGHSAPTLAASVYNKHHEGRKRLLAGIRLVHQELGELT